MATPIILHWQYKTPFGWALWALLLVMVTAACAKQHAPAPSPEVEAVTGGGASMAISPPEVRVEITEPPVEWSGRFIFTQNGLLKELRPNRPYATHLASNVDEHLLFQSPDSRYIVFATHDTPLNRIFVSDIQHRRTAEIDTLRGDWWQPITWSPDNEWVALSIEGRGVDIVRLDGKTRHIDVGSDDALVYWLNNGNFLVIEPDYQASTDMLLFSDARMVDAQSGKPEMLPIRYATGAVNWIQVEASLASMGMSIVNFEPGLFNSSYTLEPVDPNGSQTCRTWQISSLARRPVYTVGNTYRLSNLSGLFDGDWLFLHWALPDCQLNTPKVALLRLHLEDTTYTAEILTDEIFGGIGFSQFSAHRLAQSALYDLSPDGSRVVWIGGGWEAATTSLNILDLETGANTVIYEEPVDQRSTQRMQSYISAVFWLTP